MAEPFASIKEEHPIIRDVPAASKAKGYENLATVFGQIQQTGTEIAVDYNREVSHNNMLASHAQLDDLDVKTKEAIMKNPSMSKQIVEKATATANSIKDNTKLNKADRANFDYMTNGTLNNLKLYGFERQNSLDKQMEHFEFARNFDNNNKALTRALASGDNKKAEILTTSTTEDIKGKVARGVISAEQGIAYLKQVEYSHQVAEALHGGMTSGDISPAQAIALNHTMGNQQLNIANLPADEASRVMAASHSEHLSADQIRSNIANGYPVNELAYFNLKNIDTVTSLAQYRDGATMAYGELHSNKSWPELKAEQARLNKEKYPSQFTKGKSDRFNALINSIENGNGYYQMVSETPLGAKAIQDAHTQVEMIKNDKGLSDADKAIHMGAINNNLMSQLNSVGIAMGVPDRYRHLMPKEEIDAINVNLFSGGDPSLAISNLAQLSPNNRAMIANSMPNPVKAMATYTIGQLINRGEKGFMNDLALANQDNLELRPELLKDKKTNDQKIMTKLQGNTDFRNVMGLLSHYPPDSIDKMTLNGGMMKMAINYVNWRAHRGNDPAFSNMGTYIDDFNKNINRAFNVISEDGMVIDKNAINPNLSDHQYQTLKYYAIDKVRESKLASGLSNAEVDNELSKNPPTLISTPTGRLAVVDAFGAYITDHDGNPIFDQPYDTGTLSMAEHYEREHGRAFYRMTQEIGYGKEPVSLAGVHQGETLAGNIHRFKEDVRMAEQKEWSDLIDDNTFTRLKNAPYKMIWTELNELKERQGIKFDVAKAARTIKDHPHASLAQMTGILPVIQGAGRLAKAVVE